MNYFVMSDIHIDFFFLKLWENDKEIGYKAVAKKLGNTVSSKIYENCVPSFQKYYELYMAPAEALIFAGDCANDYYTQVNFYKFLTTIYNDVYVVFGNHDLSIKATFGNGNPVKYSEDRCSMVEQEFKNNPHIHILNSPEIINGIGGTMGMCDLHYTTLFDIGMPEKIKIWRKNWFDGKNWHFKTKDWKISYKINPIAFSEYEKSKLMEIVKQQPKILMTHFAPIELGVQRWAENSTSTCFFYFDSKKFLDELDHETWWFCGHIHAIGHCDYLNAKGQTIHIWALPQGYPGENPYVEGAFELKLEDGKYQGYNALYTLVNRKFDI